MGVEVREFLQMEKRAVVEMDVEELAAEVEGWRMVVSLFPLEAVEWAARLNDVVRFTKRNYTGQAGLLLGVKLEATEFTIGLQELTFDSLTGKHFVENKVLTLPAAAVMYFECINDRVEHDPLQSNRELQDVAIG